MVLKLPVGTISGGWLISHLEIEHIILWSKISAAWQNHIDDLSFLMVVWHGRE
jgi:hypothetical protein